jgi:hypothetical protein
MMGIRLRMAPTIAIEALGRPIGAVKISVAKRDKADAGAQPTCVDCKARAHAAYGAVASRELQGIERLRREVRRVKAKRIIHREREALDAVYTLFDGWAFRFRLLDDGRRQIFSFLLPGSPIGLPVYASPDGPLSRPATPASAKRTMNALSTLGDEARGSVLPVSFWNFASVLSARVSS